jgi:putative ABC transport system substrate-binding protein
MSPIAQNGHPRRFGECLPSGGAAASWPLVARAQQSSNLRRVGLLPIGYRQTDPEGEVRVTAFLDAFRKLGWSDGRNVRVEVRWLSNETEQIRVETKVLVESASDVIVISSTAAVAALQKLDRKIPAVFVQVSDPSAADSSAASRDPRVISPAFGISRPRWAASGWGC